MTATEVPQVLADVGATVFSQWGNRCVMDAGHDKHTVKWLRQWPFYGTEFSTAEQARTGDYHRYQHTLHLFRSWDDALTWMRGVDGGHSATLYECPQVDCAEYARRMNAAMGRG